MCYGSTLMGFCYFYIFCAAAELYIEDFASWKCKGSRKSTPHLSHDRPANRPPYRSVKCGAWMAELAVRLSWFWLVGCPGRCRWVRPENRQMQRGFSPIKMASKRVCRVRSWEAKDSSQIQRLGIVCYPWRIRRKDKC